MSCGATTVHEGQTYTCTIDPAPHSTTVRHMAPYADNPARLHRWGDDENVTTDDAPRAIVCGPAIESRVGPDLHAAGSTPTPTNVAAAVRIANAALDAGWETQFGGDSTTVVLKVKRDDEHGTITWKMNDDGAWRFVSCMIGVEKFGARQVAVRLARKRATPPAEVAATVAAAVNQIAHLGPHGYEIPAAPVESIPGPPAEIAAAVFAGAPIAPTALAFMTAPPDDGLDDGLHLGPHGYVTLGTDESTVARSVDRNGLAVATLAPPPPSVAPASPVMPVGTLASFMAAAPPPAGKGFRVQSNTPWGEAYAGEIRSIIEHHGRNSARNLQVHLGPSEIGVPCARQVTGKLAGLPATNNITDPWPSIMGTAGHTWLADAFAKENARRGLRWVPENRVTPHPDHSGTADLYDAQEAAVVDWKLLGEDSLAKIVNGEPSIQYQVQLKLYGRGYRLLGLPVKRVVLIALPRTKSTLNGMYVWDHELTEADDQQIEGVFQNLIVYKGWSAEIAAGRMNLLNVPATPDNDTCYFCPFYRPDSSTDPAGIGCPGTAGTIT